MTRHRLRDLLTALCMLQATTVSPQAPAPSQVGDPARVATSPRVPTAPTALSLQSAPAWSPDGSRLVTVATAGAHLDLWVTQLDTGASTAWTDDDAIESDPEWSPNGQCIVYVVARTLSAEVDVKCADTPARRVMLDAGTPHWSSDGKQIFGTATRAGRRVLLAAPANGEGQTAEILPWLSSQLSYFTLDGVRPDGHHLFIRGVSRERPFGAWIVALDSSGPLGQAVVEFASAFKGIDLSGLYALTLAPAGDALYIGTRGKEAAQVWRLPLDPRGKDRPGRLESLAKAAADVVSFAVSPDGSRLAVAWQSSQTRVWVYPFNVETGVVETDKGRPVGPEGVVSVSPDFTAAGDRLVYATWSRETNRQELHVREADGSDRVVAADADQRYGPRWSPDGTTLAYRWQSSKDHKFVVRLMDVQRGTERDLTSAFPNSLYTPFWWTADREGVLASLEYDGPDGKKAYAIAQMPIRSSDHKAKVIAANNSFQLWQSSVSRDGRWMTLVAQPLDNTFSSLLAMPATGGQWNTITDQRGWDDKPRWSPDGRTIYFLSRRSGEFELWSLPFNPQAGTAAGSPRRITSISTPQRHMSRDVGSLELAIGSTQMAVPIEELESRFAVMPMPPPAAAKE